MSEKQFGLKVSIQTSKKSGGFALVLLLVISRVTLRSSLNYLVPRFPPSNVETNLPHENESVTCSSNQKLWLSLNSWSFGDWKLKKQTH